MIVLAWGHVVMVGMDIPRDDRLSLTLWAIIYGASMAAFEGNRRAKVIEKKQRKA